MSNFHEIFRIKDGKSTHKWNSKLGQFLTTLEDGEYECTVQPLEISKSNEQNRYFNGVLVQIFMKETGFTFRDCKRFLKKEFGEKYLTTNPITNEKEFELKSQGEYSINEMSSLIERSQQFLRHDLGLNFPDVEEWKNMSAEERKSI